MNSQKAEIIELLESSGRSGMEKVIDYLENTTDFFYIPSCLHRHGRHHHWRGGLAQHSLGVCRKALAENSGSPRESVIISALLHDICKADQYRLDGKGGLIRHWKPRGQKGHGSRSIWLINSLGVRLTDQEFFAIRYHMWSYSQLPHSHNKEKDSMNIRLWKLIHNSDHQDAKENMGKRPDY